MGKSLWPPRRLLSAVTAVAAAGAISGAAALATTAQATTAPAARTAAAQQCADPYPATRNPANPLMLPAKPGANPLNGASFWVPGPRTGAAAMAIEKLLGIDPTHYDNRYSWAQFQYDLNQGRLHARVTRSRTTAYDVAMLEKIASEPQAIRFSAYSGGGGPGAIFGQVQKILCNYLVSDPGSVPIITTYFLHDPNGCMTRAEILQKRATFQRRVNELAEGIARRPALMLLELDAVGASECMARNGALPLWEANIRYEINKISALPHTVVYVEGGYSDSAGPVYTAKVLRAVGVKKIRGFFTNDTHNAWTIDEIKWADRVVKLLHGSHFIVNTATNGRGPLLEHNRVKNGNEVLCNAPDRGLGPKPTTSTGFAHVDAFLFTGVPGNSTGTCNGGPAPGTFWTARAIQLAHFANGRLGPGYPSRPY